MAIITIDNDRQVRNYIADGLGELVNSGQTREVYRIGDDGVAKIIKGSGRDESSILTAVRVLSKEYDISRRLKNGGVNVPDPRGIYKVTHPETLEVVPAFVMRYINGVDIEQCLEFPDIMAMWQTEINKARKLGFIPRDTKGDSKPQNAIYDSMDNKVYLHDFLAWRENGRI